MQEFLIWLYDHYIKRQIENVEMDDGDKFRFLFVDGDHTEEEKKDFEAAFRFYACHAFLLGLRTGVGLSSSLS